MHGACNGLSQGNEGEQYRVLMHVISCDASTELESESQMLWTLDSSFDISTAS